MIKRPRHFDTIDLNEVQLYGFQSACNIILVDAIIRGIKVGDRFAPLDVLELDEETFMLAGSGGHHRAVGHYINNSPLKVRVIGKEFDYSGAVPMGKIMLFDHRELPPYGVFASYAFERRSSHYPRIDWERWGLIKLLNLKP